MLSEKRTGVGADRRVQRLGSRQEGVPATKVIDGLFAFPHPSLIDDVDDCNEQNGCDEDDKLDDDSGVVLVIEGL